MLECSGWKIVLASSAFGSLAPPLMFTRARP